jgi:hypothetical protein
MSPVRSSPSSTNSRAGSRPTIVRGADTILQEQRASFSNTCRIPRLRQSRARDADGTNALDRIEGPLRRPQHHRTFSPYFCVAGGTIPFMSCAGTRQSGRSGRLCARRQPRRC